MAMFEQDIQHRPLDGRMETTDYNLLGLSYPFGPSGGKRKRLFGSRARSEKGNHRAIQQLPISG